MTTMSLPREGLVLPAHLAHKSGIAAVAAAVAHEEIEADAAKGAMLPKPVGFKLLCAVPEMSEQFEDSVLLKSRQTIANDEVATTVLFVLDLGPDAYSDTVRFPNGPWCKKGDFVIVRTYSGTRFKIFGKEFRVINDDMVEATVSDPRGVLRVQA